MIYFEFTISRHLHSSESEFELPTADFMFDSDNPAECTRQAAMMLRSRGWKPVSVKQACEGFELADFHLGEHVAELFHKAQRGGISFSLNEKSSAARVSRELV